MIACCAAVVACSCDAGRIVSFCAAVPGAVTSFCADTPEAVAIIKTVVIQKIDIAFVKCEIALIYFIMKICLIKLLRTSNIYTGGKGKNF